MAILGSFIVPHPPMIIKEIGMGSEKQIENTIRSYKEIAKKIKELRPDTIIISSPHTKISFDSFTMLSTDTIQGNFRRFGHPEISFMEQNDLELVKEIERVTKQDSVQAIASKEEIELDHGCMVPLSFIEEEYQDFKIIVIGLSGKSYVEHYMLGKRIQESVENLHRNVVYIASGDLSHKLQKYGPYGFIKEGPIYDEKVMKICQNKDFLNLITFDETLTRKASECGHRSFIMMAGFLDQYDVDVEFLSHEDITGVGYGILSYTNPRIDHTRNFLDIYLKLEKERIQKIRNNQDEYIRLAYQSIESYVKYQKKIEVPPYTSRELLDNRKGVFVTIYKWNRLRGCIGSIIPTNTNIAEEIISKAISSSTFDPRFHPITEDELDYLEIHVDILEPLEQIDSLDKLDVKKYGVVISSGFKRGVLLPNIETVETVEDQIRIAMEKGDITLEDDIIIERFEVTRHE